MKEDNRQTNHQRTEVLAYLIYLNEKKPAECADDHWKRAEESLRRLDEAPASPLRHDPPQNHHEQATLRPEGHGDIAGLAMIRRERPDEGGKFYPADIHDLNVSLNLPATLHLKSTAETFDLVQLAPGYEGEACYVMSFRE